MSFLCTLHHWIHWFSFNYILWREILQVSNKLTIKISILFARRGSTGRLPPSVSSKETDLNIKQTSNSSLKFLESSFKSGLFFAILSVFTFDHLFVQGRIQKCSMSLFFLTFSLKKCTNSKKNVMWISRLI